MPSLCQNLSSHYAHLRTLTDEFTTKYERVRDFGDLTEVRRLKMTLEQARDSLLEQLFVFEVPDAINPYHEALLEAGLDPNETQERQGMTLDIRKEIKRQLAVYREAKDANRQPLLQEWITNISENEDLLYAEVAKDRAKIVERIKAGMIPIVMPSRTVQDRTWKVACSSLKPVWFKGGIKKPVKDPHLYSGYETEKMNHSSFFKNIPDRPYLIWVKPTQNPSTHTMGTSFDDQRTYNIKLVTDHPNLYDITDIIPTEYSVLQTMFTSTIKDRYQNLKGASSNPTEVLPLDCVLSTRFLSAGLFSNGHAPHGEFDIDHSWVLYGYSLSKEIVLIGFRPASRT